MYECMSVPEYDDVYSSHCNHQTSRSRHPGVRIPLTMMMMMKKKKKEDEGRNEKEKERKRKKKTTHTKE